MLSGQIYYTKEPHIKTVTYVTVLYYSNSTSVHTLNTFARKAHREYAPIIHIAIAAVVMLAGESDAIDSKEL